jgi:hypothetical protein
MRNSLCTVGALTVFLLTSVMHTASAQNCQDILDNNSYRCLIKPLPTSGNQDTEVCFTFEAEPLPTMVTGFLLHIDGGFASLACGCKAQGSFNNPKFETSKEFLCASIPNPDVSNLAIEGVAGNNKISGQAIQETDGTPLVYECVLDPTCEGSQVGTQTTHSPWKRSQR